MTGLKLHSMRRGLLRFAAGVGVVVLASACSSSSGCSGCGMGTIPGGFPSTKIVENEVQVRLTQGGITFLESNLDPLLAAALPSGLSFAIPPTGCSSSGSSQFKVCCKTGATCNAAASVAKTQLKLTAPDTIDLDLQAKVWTGTGSGTTKKVVAIPVEVNFSGIGIACDMAFDSTKGKKTAIRLLTTLQMSTAKTAPKKLALKASKTDIKDIEAEDLKISGSSALCGPFDVFLHAPGVYQTFEPMIKSALLSALDGALNQQIASLPLGQEGRMDMGTLMAQFSPRTSGNLDFYVWAGGYASVDTSPGGMSLGVLTGFDAAKQSACVPDCEKKTAPTCSPPTRSAVTASSSFKVNKTPDGADFHMGIGVHRQALESAMYNLYKSGAVCLDVGTDTVSMITSTTLSALLPSLAVLTGGATTAARIAVRPGAPPTVQIGKGTYTSSGGTTTITDPLLTVGLPKLVLDFYIDSEGRPVRVFRVTGDLSMPLLLYPNAKGQLQPLLGDLSKALTNIQVTDTDLMTEAPATIAAMFPTLLKLAAGQLASALPAVDIPSFSGLKLVLGKGAITGVDPDKSGKAYDYLGIFAKLATSSTSTTTPSMPPAGTPFSEPIPPSLDTAARVARFDPADAAQFRRDTAEGREPKLPRLVLDVSATLPEAIRGAPYEVAWRLDGGLYQGWVTGPMLVIEDARLWIPGRHEVEVMARAIDHPQTLDPTPARVQITVDPQPPTAEELAAAGGCSMGGPTGAAGLTLLALLALALAARCRRRPLR